MIILLDAMGGDNAPDANIKGAVKAINQIQANVVLIGKEEVIKKRIKELYGKDNITEISGKCTHSSSVGQSVGHHQSTHLLSPLI